MDIFGSFLKLVDAGLKTKPVISITDKNSANALIDKLGEQQRQLQQLEIEMNEKIAEIQRGYTPAVTEIRQEIRLIVDSLKVYCEQNRNELCGEGVKTATFDAGEVKWRMPAASLLGCTKEREPKIIQQLKEMGYGDFVRTEESVIKDAIKNQPELMNKLGLKLSNPKETMAIIPNETKIEAI